MTPKEVKAALQDEAVQAAIEKIVAKEVAAERKRCLGELKAASDGLADTELGKAEKKAVAAILKEAATTIKG